MCSRAVARAAASQGSIVGILGTKSLQDAMKKGRRRLKECPPTARGVQWRPTAALGWC